ncbi:MAG: tautomerase PptA [Clostridiales bacterium]|jgi:4-oxalocrotonate tautomerase|nr:tautomerase PptA [Clostridiales bacterium]
MPHVEIKCYPGRTEEVKTKCAEEVAKTVAASLGCDESSVSVAIKEIEKEEWKNKVWDTQIAPEKDSLYKKPGYTCE